MIGKIHGSSNPPKALPSSHSQSSKDRTEKEVKLGESKLKAFAEEEDVDLAPKPKLQSLAQLKKDIEEEKSRPVQEQPKKSKDSSAAKPRQKLPAKAQQQPTTANIVQKVIAIDKAPKSYSELANEDEKYQTWVPPTGQTGDGRTSLNDKLGY